MKKQIEFGGPINNVLLLMSHFVLLLLIYALLRVGFLWYNQSLFPNVGFSEVGLMLFGGVKFDIVALLYINLLYILMQCLPLPIKYNDGYQKIASWVFIFTNSVGIASNLIDFAYYPFTLKRTTGTVFSQFAHEDNIIGLFLDFFILYWPLVIIFLTLVYLLYFFDRKLILLKPSKVNWQFYITHLGTLLFVAFLFVGGVRGGWAHSTRPITLSNAGDYVKNPEEISVVLNTPFSILKTLKAVNLKEVNVFTEEELEGIYPVFHQPQDGIAFQKHNVVFLIMESFAKEYVGFYNRDLESGTYKGYTPFLDSLIAESYSFKHSFANGRKSIDALPSIITGIPSIGEPFVLSIYSSNKTTSIADLLGEEGYETAFFHGAPNGSMGFSAFTNLAGIKRYYGKNEYNNDTDFDGIWGIWDEPFMQFMGDKLNELPEPFFASFFSLSSHHPFKVPIEYEGKFPKGPLPVHEPIGYTDHALREFFAKVSKSSWYKNTLFVICADHSSVSYLSEYKTTANSYAIPIAFYFPGDNRTLRGISDKLIQQIDIMPTVLNFLGYNKPYFSLGFDAFSSARNNFVVNNTTGVYNFFKGDYFMTHNGNEALSLFNLKRDPLESDNIVKNSPEVVDSLEVSLKAFIQQYNNRMIHNKLTVD